MAQTFLIPGAGTRSGKTVSMETGTVEMLSEIAPWGSATNRNISMRRPKYSCVRGDSSSPKLGWDVALEQMHRARPNGVFNILVFTLPSLEVSNGKHRKVGAGGFVPLPKSPSEACLGMAGSNRDFFFFVQKVPSLQSSPLRGPNRKMFSPVRDRDYCL